MELRNGGEGIALKPNAIKNRQFDVRHLDRRVVSFFWTVSPPFVLKVRRETRSGERKDVEELLRGAILVIQYTRGGGTEDIILGRPNREPVPPSTPP